MLTAAGATVCVVALPMVILCTLHTAARMIHTDAMVKPTADR